MPIGALIGAGASLLGGLFGNKAQKDSNEANLAAQREMNAQNIALQKEFAQHGIRWKVEDARAAGIHPIYALGGSTHSFTPVSANFQSQPLTALPNAMAAAGQDLGRAVNATRTGGERVDAFTKTAQALQLENMSLQNDVLRTEIASKSGRLVQAANPPMPSPGDQWLVPGQAQSGLVKNKIQERIGADPLKPSQEPGAVTDTGHLRTSGGLFPVPSKDAKEQIEDNLYQETMHFLRNNLLPMISPHFNEPPHPADKGKVWVYDPVFGYKQVPDRFINKFLRSHVRD